MKRLIYAIFALLFTAKITAQPTNKESLEWFTNAKLGMFIHWGLYSQTAGIWKGKPSRGGEHFMLYERIPLKEYAKIAEEFNPSEYNAEKWVRTAKLAGMKYIIITAKHHDGFSMYNSEVSDYDIVDCSAYAKDPMVDLIKECRKQGLKFGFYYSLGRDWENPDVPTNWPEKGGRSNTWDYPDEDSKQLPLYIENKVKPQLRELLTNYGTIDFIWFDTPELVTKEQSSDLRKLILSIQPKCLINERIGNNMGDYRIVEQRLNSRILNEPWESCLTLGRNWGYNIFDTIYKAPEVTIRHLCDIVSKGGNLLLNFSPDGKGLFPKQSDPTMKMLHSWMSTNGEAIYNTRPWRVYGENLDASIQDEKVNMHFHDAEYDGTPKNIIPDFRYTAKNNNVYVIARNVESSQYILKSFSACDNIKSVKCISEDVIVKWNISDKGLEIFLEKLPQNNPIYVLKVEFDDLSSVSTKR